MSGATSPRAAKQKLSKREPREFSANAWYYVNNGSVDVILRQGFVSVTLKRRVLLNMLSELRPLKKRRR